MALFGAPAPPKDVECPFPPGADSITGISWSPVAGYLAAASWDGYVRVWEVAKDAQGGAASAAGKLEQRSEGGAPLLDLAWRDDDSAIFFAGADHAARMMPLANPAAATTVAAHEAPIRHVAWVKEIPALITAGWDRAICAWDVRAPSGTPALKLALSERVWAMDVKYPWVVAATADRKIHMYNLTAPHAAYRVIESPLTHQTRVVRMFHEQQCYCIGTIEGRVAVRYIEERVDTESKPGEADKLKNSFSFRCHRQGAYIYPVNAIDTHPHAAYRDVFATAGSDGVLVFWNKAKKLKLKEYATFSNRNSIAALAWNAAGTQCAYAASYDYHRGVEGTQPAQPPTQLLVHNMQSEDMQPKA